MDRAYDSYWLAGLLEGEASLLAARPSREQPPAVVLQMTDCDVVERAARILDRAVHRWVRGNGLRKPVFITSTKGASAVSLMRSLRPVFGLRRVRQIDRALAEWTERPIKWRTQPATCGTAGCPRTPSIKGLCRQHYKSWWKSRKRGRRSRYVPRSASGPIRSETALVLPPPTDDRSVAWLAGLLEGEGTFSISRERGGYGYPIIAVNMTDEDVVRRAALIMSIDSVRPRQPRRANWSVTYVARVSGQSAAEWMRRLRPHMGERRGHAIDKALAAYRPIRLVDPPRLCVVERCGKSHESRGLCHRHYMSWSRDRAKGRPPRVTPLR